MQMTVEEKEAALIRAAGEPDGRAGLVKQIAKMLVAGAAMQRAEREEEAAAPPRQVWGSRKQVATHFGVTPNALDKWLPKLIRAGKVRVLTPEGGYTRYNIPDIEKAFSAPAVR